MPSLVSKNAKLTNLIDQLSPDVSTKCIVNCGEVLAETGCILAAIATDDPVALRLCFKAVDFSKVSSF
jgi:hypothetical protein